MRDEPEAGIRGPRAGQREKGVGELGQQGGGHRGRHPLRSVLRRTCRICARRKWMVLQPRPDSQHFVVGGRAGSCEARAWVRVEEPAELILVGVATIRMGIPKTVEETGSCLWCSGQGEPGPKAAYAGERESGLESWAAPEGGDVVCAKWGGAAARRRLLRPGPFSADC
jgi:hypothetical protein